MGKIDSAAQLRAAQAQVSVYTSAQEAEAKRQGFRNADELAQFNRQLSIKRNSVIQGGAKKGQPAPPTQAPQRAPMSVLEMAMRAASNAMRGGK